MTDPLTTRLVLGTRVTVRHRIDDPEHPLTDAVGDVVELDEARGVVVIRTRRGDVTVPLAAITAVRQVPPAPPRRAPRRPDSQG